jgi:hypothetical protein
LINYAKPIVAEHGAGGCGFQRDAVQGEESGRGNVVASSLRLDEPAHSADPTLPSSAVVVDIRASVKEGRA